MSPVSNSDVPSFNLLRDRAERLEACRRFFAERRVMEVDVALLSHAASVDAHIDLVEARCCGTSAYLHSSPEYGMKRLLAAGSGDIYQLSHVFRDHERGARHTVEFMMVEWYRLGFTLEEMIAETIELITLFLPRSSEGVEKLTYQQAFLTYAGNYPTSKEERDYLFGFTIEPALGQKRVTVLTDYPPEAAVLARIGENGLAERFELFYQGVELANGFREATSSQELRQRFLSENETRRQLGKGVYPLDEAFLRAVENLPDCSGVAVGFDRLMMLRHQQEEIREVSCFFI